MRFSPALMTGMLIPIAALCLCAQAQSAPGKDAPGNDIKGIPPRTAPADYQAHAQAGTVTIAAEFKGHSIPTSLGPLSSEDYVAVEIGWFGPADARVKIASADFSLRINVKKAPLPAQPYGLVVGSVKDPEWVPPEPPASKSKTSMGGGGGGGRGEQGESNSPPVPPPIPFPVQRAMAQRVQKAALPEGDRALPQAGLIFFQYRGKPQSIHSVELLYASPAGKATLTLQP
jgi:hypothetical protein